MIRASRAAISAFSSFAVGLACAGATTSAEQIPGPNLSRAIVDGARADRQKYPKSQATSVSDRPLASCHHDRSWDRMVKTASNSAKAPADETGAGGRTP